MVTLKCQAIILNAISSALGWLGFSLAISALTNPSWQITSTHRVGLFHTCNMNITSGPCEVTPVAPWLSVVKAFLIMMVIFIFAAIAVSDWFTESSCCKTHLMKIKRTSNVLFMIAGVWGLISLSVYTGNTSSSAEGYYSTSFILGWTSVWCPFFAGIFVYLAAHKFEKVLDSGECE